MCIYKHTPKSKFLIGIQELVHARLCVIVLAHVHVRVRSHVSVMCLCVVCDVSVRALWWWI